MSFPQTEAMRWAEIFPNDKKLYAIAHGGCLALCYLYCVGIISDDAILAVQNVKNAMDKGLLDSNCSVLDADKFLEHFTGRKFRVEKRKIDSIDSIKDATPVCYEFNGNQHWVVIENGKIVFNPLRNSVCVAKGKPTDSRIINKV